jgi:hypothetical protein
MFSLLAGGGKLPTWWPLRVGVANEQRSAAVAKRQIVFWVCASILVGPVGRKVERLSH